MEYTLYLDESGDKGLKFIDNIHPVLCVTGCIIERHYYTDVVKPLVNEFKIKYWGRSDVILISSAIRKKEGDFSFLAKDKDLAQSFYNDINGFMNDLEYTVIAIVIDKRRLCHQYVYPVDPYDLSLRFIIERYTFFLNAHHGRIKAESRGKAEDKLLLKEYTKMSNRGVITSRTFQISQVYILKIRVVTLLGYNLRIF